MRYDNDTALSDYDRQLHLLLNAAIDLPSGQLEAFLERAAASPELALEAEVLLREQESQKDFLRPPLPGLLSRAATVAALPSPAPTGAAL